MTHRRMGTMEADLEQFRKEWEDEEDINPARTGATKLYPWQKPLEGDHKRLEDLCMTESSDENQEEIRRLLDGCPDPEGMDCGRAVCPHREPLHFHHDGCPACYFDPPNQESEA